jgi:hypothetical protein
MACDNTFLSDSIATLETIIRAYDAAILALAVNGIQAYTLDTGQSRQTVTQLDLADLRKTRTSMYNEYVTLCARLNGTGTIVGRPGW